MATDKLTVCNTCGAEIAKSAKTCPKCGAKQKKGHPILKAIGIIFLALIVLGAFGSVNTPKKVGDVSTTGTAQQTTATSKPVATNPPSKTKFGVGEKVELNNVVVTLLGVTESYGSQFNKPSEGNEFVLCEFEIENNSSKEITVSSIMSFNAYCDDYTLSYSLQALMEKGNNQQLDGTIASGKKFKGVIGYEVPTDWKEVEIHFTPDFWTSKNIIFVANH